MQGIILAGGEGKRMQPLSMVMPKCLLPVYGKPCCRHLVEALTKDNFQILIAIQEHHKPYFEHEFRDSSLSFVIVPRFTGTAGALKAIIENLEDNFLVAYGDMVGFNKFNELVAGHKKLPITVAVSRGIPVDKGIFISGSMGKRVFKEKPVIGIGATWLGVCVMERSLLDDIQPEDDIASNIISPYSEQQQVYEVFFDIPWQSVGDWSSYLQLLGGTL